MRSTSTHLNNKVLEELRDKYPKMRKSDITKIIRDYYRQVHRLTSYGNKVNDSSYVKRIEVPILGSIVFNRNGVRNAEEGKIENQVDKEAYLQVNTILYLSGWRLLMWTKNRGYTFYNENTGEEFSVNEQHIKGKRQAVLFFYNFINKDEKSNLINQLSYTGRILMYNDNFELLKYFKSFENIEDKYPDSINEILKSIIFNSTKCGSTFTKKAINRYWIREVDLERVGILRKGRSTKHLYFIDMIDKNTGEVIMKRYGNPKDYTEYLKAVENVATPKVDNIVKCLDSDKTAYGYRWKRS